AIAAMAAEINRTAENIGARRLHTVLERLLEELSFEAPERSGEKVEVGEEMVRERLGELVGDSDLARYIL
ncbi:MAG: HslU--HslV peptidase ATPase subunit, partial [Acidobacteriota bacterium]